MFSQDWFCQAGPLDYFGVIAILCLGLMSLLFAGALFYGLFRWLKDTSLQEKTENFGTVLKYILVFAGILFALYCLLLAISEIVKHFVCGS